MIALLKQITFSFSIFSYYIKNNRHILNARITENSVYQQVYIVLIIH